MIGPRGSTEARLDYSGTWSRSSAGASEWRNEQALALAPAEGDHPDAADGETLRRLQRDTARSVNQWYDRTMYAPGLGPFGRILSERASRRFERSGFRNYGYWAPGIRTRVDASEELMEVLLAFIPQKVGTILDVACGIGGTTRYLLNYYDADAVTGINISSKQLRTCRQLAPGCRFLKMSATDMSFPPGSFANIICVEAAHHFVTREKFATEAHRVLAPFGSLVLSDLVWPKDRTVWWTPVQQRGMGPRAYRDLYLRAGFERVEIVDATDEVLGGLSRSKLRSLRSRLRRGLIDEKAFRRARARILSRNTGDTYYLLVAAQKGAS